MPVVAYGRRSESREKLIICTHDDETGQQQTAS